MGKKMRTSASAAVFSNYFAYGSNLQLKQLEYRCPHSVFTGVARLPGWNWIIMKRGYANIVPISKSNPPLDKHFPESWGLIFRMPPEDEKKMDFYEGAPTVYRKLTNLEVDFWPAVKQGDTTKSIDVTKDPQKLTVMTYVDVKNVVPSKPLLEYITRINLGIRDALALGVPEGYINAVLRKFIPPEKALSVDVGMSSTQLLKQTERDTRVVSRSASGSTPIVDNPDRR